MPAGLARAARRSEDSSLANPSIGPVFPSLANRQQRAMSEQAWDTHPAAFRILPSFQQHAPNPHEHWRFLRSEGRDKNRARWTVPKERSVVSLTARFINNRCVELLGSRNVNMNGPRLLTSICHIFQRPEPVHGDYLFVKL